MTAPWWQAPQDIVLGDYVETDTHKHRGRVYKIHPGWPAGSGCPESDEWLAGQQPEPLTAYKNDRWISVLVHEGGAVTVPASLAHRVEPFDFENGYAKQYFRPADEAPIPWDLRLSFTPDAIREHFEGDEPDPTEGMTDEQLAEVGRTALTDDMLYDAFHGALVWALDEERGESE